MRAVPAGGGGRLVRCWCAAPEWVPILAMTDGISMSRGYHCEASARHQLRPLAGAAMHPPMTDGISISHGYHCEAPPPRSDPRRATHGIAADYHRVPCSLMQAWIRARCPPSRPCCDGIEFAVDAGPGAQGAGPGPPAPWKQRAARGNRRCAPCHDRDAPEQSHPPAFVRHASSRARYKNANRAGTARASDRQHTEDQDPGSDRRCSVKPMPGGCRSAGRSVRPG
jgi:hypothetical protein